MNFGRGMAMGTGGYRSMKCLTWENLGFREEWDSQK